MRHTSTARGRDPGGSSRPFSRSPSRRSPGSSRSAAHDSSSIRVVVLASAAPAVRGAERLSGSTLLSLALENGAHGRERSLHSFSAERRLLRMRSGRGGRGPAAWPLRALDLRVTLIRKASLLPPRMCSGGDHHAATRRGRRSRRRVSRDPPLATLGTNSASVTVGGGKRRCSGSVDVALRQTRRVLRFG